MHHLFKYILYLWGWSIKATTIQNIDHSIIIIAPHTSNWDYVIARMAGYQLGISAQYMIKKETSIFPLNILIKATGGIPIDRKTSTGIVPSIAKLFSTYKSLHLGITPEGTRKKAACWKSGFYHIACQAKVPILLAYLDYKNKEFGIHTLLEPSGNIDQDMVIIENYYKNSHPLYPDRWNPVIWPKKTNPKDPPSTE